MRANVAVASAFTMLVAGVLGSLWCFYWFVRRLLS